MCCYWCDSRGSKLMKVGLVTIWQRCMRCETLTYVDPYTGCCGLCRAPVTDKDNVTVICDKVPVGACV